MHIFTRYTNDFAPHGTVNMIGKMMDDWYVTIFL